MTLFVSTILILLPLFLVVAAGFLLARIFRIEEESLIRVLTDFFMPLLVFASLYESTIGPAELGKLFGATTLMILLLLLAAYIYAGAARINPRGFSMPIVFMNSGFLGIPLMKLWGGVDAMNIIIVFDQIQTLYIFTLGFLIIRGGINREAIRSSLGSPILWAVVLGFTFNLTGASLPEPLLETCRFGGAAAPPLAAFVLGISLNSRKPVLDRHLVAGMFLRTVAGFLIGLAVVRIFRFQGLTATVLMVTGALPGAVFSYVLPARYGIDCERAQAIVAATSALSVFTVPLSFALATMFQSV